MCEASWGLVIANNSLPWAEIVRKGTNKFLYLVQNGKEKREKMSGYRQKTKDKRLKTKDEGRKTKVERRRTILFFKIFY